mmetsp:Transcript_21362/g.67230  ORF Transcript_21362/g.67230 Transcript_21362/m.67230 type:complete len:212 (-) Transcript_21362:790-1425(-)
MASQSSIWRRDARPPPTAIGGGRPAAADRGAAALDALLASGACALLAVGCPAVGATLSGAAAPAAAPGGGLAWSAANPQGACLARNAGSRLATPPAAALPSPAFTHPSTSAPESCPLRSVPESKLCRNRRPPSPPSLLSASGPAADPLGTPRACRNRSALMDLPSVAGGRAAVFWTAGWPAAGMGCGWRPRAPVPSAAGSRAGLSLAASWP